VAARAEAQHLTDKQSLAAERTKVKELQRSLQELRDRQDEEFYHKRVADELADQEEAEEALGAMVELTESKKVGNLAAELFGASRPGVEDAAFDDEVEDAVEVPTKIPPPPQFAGHLQKKSPSAWRMMQPFQERFFVLELGRLSWWECKGRGPGHEHGSTAKGSVDFGINLCVLQVAEEGQRFNIAPQDGTWVAGNFTNSAAGRLLEFQCTGSEHSFEEWCTAIREHIAYGARRAAAVACAISNALDFEEDDEFVPAPSNKFS